MDDRGEKIILLAREMLQAEQGAPPLASPGATHDRRQRKPVRTVATALLLGALSALFAASAPTDFQRPATRQEKVEIDALVFYLAHQTNREENAIRQDLLWKLGIASLRDMNEAEYVRARDDLRRQIP